VPAAAVRHIALAARGCVVRARLMAWRVAVASTEIDRTTAALTIERAHGNPQRVAIGILAYRERLAGLALNDDPISARRGQLREIGQRNVVSRRLIQDRSSERAVKDGPTVLLGRGSRHWVS